MRAQVPIVAIVGRANVGKSSLFNALVGRREAIVAREPGTTRDRVSGKVSHHGKDFWLVDTAGVKTAEDEFELGIQEQISEATAAAQLIVVVVEADVSVTAEDRRVAKMALKSRKPVVLVVNKIDKYHQAELADWQKLGIKSIQATSTTQNTGITDLLDVLADNLPRAKISEAKNRVRLSILGRPNVGKSSLFNSLAAKQQAPWNAGAPAGVSKTPIPQGQALVAPQAGTTRDVNRLVVRFKSREIELADTAGIRRPGRIERGVEQFSVLRSIAAIEESDICLLVMDAGEPNTQLDQKIAGMVKEAGKGLILLINKWDKYEDVLKKEEISSLVVRDFPFTPWAPLIYTSASTGQNVSKIYDLALEIDAARSTKFKTSELNKWLRQTVDTHEPPPMRRYLPKLNYIVHEDDASLPSFKIFGSNVKFLHFSYRRYLERRFREKWPLVGTPLKFWFIEKNEG